MFALADIEKPISAENPCGPDPEFDQELQNFLSVAEGQLPASYRDFNKKNFEAKPVLEQIERHFSKCRDIRFLVIAAKYAILSDNLPFFAESIAAVPALLAAQWDHCHPTEAAGGNALRSAYLQSLDDKPTIVFPLQSMPLIIDKRLGTVSMRSILVAEKKLPPRVDEVILESDALKDAFMRYEPLNNLVEISSQLAAVKVSLKQLRQIFQDKAGHDLAPMFDQLPAMADSICDYINAILKARAPADAPPSEPADDHNQLNSDQPAEKIAGSTTDIASVKEASNALEAILVYYAASEPSSPSRLLVKQAHQLVGKSFVEAMRILAPGLAEETKIKFTGDQPFSLDFAQLSALFADDSSGNGNESGEARTFIAASRAEATALMRKVELFYKAIEPSSPIPILVEQARNFVAKDFTTLLKEMAKKDETT